MDIGAFHSVQYKFEGKIYRLNFDFRISTFQKKERKSKKFDFHETLLRFLSQNPNKNLYLTHNAFGSNGFEFDNNNIFINIDEFQRFCFGLDPRIDRANAFFRQDVNIENITLVGATEEQILEWINQLSEKEKASFIEKIGSGFSLVDIKDTELVDEFKKRNVPFSQIRDILKFSVERSNNIQELQTIASGVDLRKIEIVLKIWADNKNNKNEEFWQSTFEEHNWILGQIFAAPVVFLKGKPFCGGKNPDGNGGVYSDFRFETIKTGNSIFIEIKTPLTKIVNKQYRGKELGDTNIIYSMADEITGGTIQLINQRQTAISEFEKNNQLKIRNSKGVLILGNSENLNDDEKKSFDIYRNNNRDIEIMTFDELFHKIQILKELLSN